MNESHALQMHCFNLQYKLLVSDLDNCNTSTTSLKHHNYEQVKILEFHCNRVASKGVVKYDIRK